METQHISTLIEASAEQVYTYARNPLNLPHWAAGLAQSEVTVTGAIATCTSPMGDVLVWFAEENQYGVLDHWVKIADGTIFYNPVRVIQHPGGCEVIFTLRHLDASDVRFAEDAVAVAADLRKLKEVVEANPATS